MSDSRKTRRFVREKRRALSMPEGEGMVAEGPEPTSPAGPLYAVVASGENVVMIHTVTGQTWAMASDGHGPVWHPVSFSATAPRAPRPPKRVRAEDENGAAGNGPAGAEDGLD